MDSIEYLDPYTLNGVNLYLYCNNNPIVYADPSGRFPWFIVMFVASFLVLSSGSYNKKEYSSSITKKRYKH